MTEQKQQISIIDAQKAYIAGQLKRNGCSEQEQIGNIFAILGNLYNSGLESDGIQLPTGKAEIARLGVMIHKAVAGEQQLQIVSATCPDYSYHETPNGPVYDFQSLGDAEGLTGTTLLAKEKVFRAALIAAGVPEDKIVYTLLVADVEAEDPDIRASIGLEEPEFKARVGRTRDRLATHLESPHKVGLMSTFISREDERLAGDLLKNLKHERLVSIALGRGDLYRRWFRRGQGTDVEAFVMQRTREDVRKYIAFGIAARRHGAIVLESTAPEITSLYNVGNDLPITPLVQIKNKY